MGSSTSGINTSTAPMSCGLVTISMTNPPAKISRLRKAMDAPEPMTVWISVVSVVRRERISPVRVTSKNVGFMPSTWPWICLRMSATTRSPIRATK